MRPDRNGENTQKCGHQSGHHCGQEQTYGHQRDHDDGKDMLNRWIPAVFSDSVSYGSFSCGGVSLVSKGKFGSNNEFLGNSGIAGNFCGFLGEDVGSISRGTFLGGNRFTCRGNSDIFSRGYSGLFHDDNVPLSLVEPAGFVFYLEALGALARRNIICSAAYKKKKDKIRPLDQVTDGKVLVETQII